jgi:hypothetical protein
MRRKGASVEPVWRLRVGQDRRGCEPLSFCCASPPPTAAREATTAGYRVELCPAPRSVVEGVIEEVSGAAIAGQHQSNVGARRQKRRSEAVGPRVRAQTTLPSAELAEASTALTPQRDERSAVLANAVEVPPIRADRPARLAADAVHPGAVVLRSDGHATRATGELANTRAARRQSRAHAAPQAATTTTELRSSRLSTRTSRPIARVADRTAGERPEGPGTSSESAPRERKVPMPRTYDDDGQPASGKRPNCRPGGTLHAVVLD